MQYDNYDIRTMPFAYEGPLAPGKIRSAPEDFIVEEFNHFELTGAGEHIWLKIEKRNRTTDWVASLLAKTAGIPTRDVSFAGFKDKNAVTCQWFSARVPIKQQVDWSAVGSRSEGDVRILQEVRHARKLQRGALDGNLFRLVVRDFDVEPSVLEERMRQIRERGIPNYFMEQRFGREGSNVAAYLAGQSGDKPRGPADSILLSSLRSLLFNEILAVRVRAGTWDRLIEGDILNLNGSRSSFLAESAEDPTLIERMRTGDVHPTGALWGSGEQRVTAAAKMLEDEVVAGHSALVNAIMAADLQQDRRSLRQIPSEITFSYESPVLQLHFRLDAGAYATAVLREIVSYL